MKVRAALDALSTQTSAFLAICHADGVNGTEEQVKRLDVSSGNYLIEVDDALAISEQTEA